MRVVCLINDANTQISRTLHVDRTIAVGTTQIHICVVLTAVANRVVENVLRCTLLNEQ